MIRREDVAHEEDSRLTPTTDFDYDVIDRDLFDVTPEELASLKPEDVEAACKLFRTMVRWMWQNGMKNPNGLRIRAAIVCWIFVEELKALTETELAAGFGMDKQSINRWAIHFKKYFPFIRTPHLRPIKT